MITDVTNEHKETWCWINGAFSTVDRASIPVSDSGFLLGQGLFETVRSERGMLIGWDRHWDRLQQGLGVVSWPVRPFDGRELEDVAVELVSRNELEIGAKVRLTVSPESFVMTAETPPSYAASLRVALGSRIRNACGYTRGLKTTSYLENVLALAEARDKGVDELLLLNERGELSEGACSNVFAFVEGQWRTPPLSSGCLPGITRGILLELGTAEAVLRKEELSRAEAMVFTSSLKGVLPVRQWEDSCFDPEQVRVAELQDAYRKWIGQRYFRERR
ncbi:MAG: aminotransferase class IV [Verrucomicrobiota bacterium]